MGLKGALRDSKDKTSTVYMISLSTPCHRPRHSTVYAISMSSPFHCLRHSCILGGSFAVRCGDHLRFWDHLQSNVRIICGRGSFAVSGSFAALYKPARFHWSNVTHNQTKPLSLKSKHTRKNRHASGLNENGSKCVD